MADIEGLLSRWQSAGVLESAAADRIRAFESDRTLIEPAKDQEKIVQSKAAGIAWQGVVALILGAILLACGVALFVSSHWDEIGPASRLAIVLSVLALFHLGGAVTRSSFENLSTALHAVGTLSTGAAIALVGQIFNMQEHWPAAILLWAVAALAGWALLHDQAQQTLALLLIPAWIFSEMEFYTSRHIGQEPYLGRFLLVWSIFYLTIFIGSRRRVVHGILFAAAAVAAIVGTVMMTAGWVSWSDTQNFIPFSTRFWAWVAIAAIPLAIAAFKGHWGLIPPAAAVVFSVALPWCQHLWIDRNGAEFGIRPGTRNEANLAAHALVAAFAICIIWWGVRRVSRALVNLGMVYFAIAVGWFYFSNILDKMGRSLGLIGLGILFLAGGWLLERTRRRLLAGMDAAPAEAR